MRFRKCFSRWLRSNFEPVKRFRRNSNLKGARSESESDRRALRKTILKDASSERMRLWKDALAGKTASTPQPPGLKRHPHHLKQFSQAPSCDFNRFWILFDRFPCVFDAFVRNSHVKGPLSKKNFKKVITRPRLTGALVWFQSNFKLLWQISMRFQCFRDEFLCERRSF